MRIALIAAVLSCGALLSQPLTFDAASVKVSPPPGEGRMIMMDRGGRGGPGSNDPTRMTFNNSTLMNLIAAAYNVKNYQITGPAWLNQDRYEVIGTIPPGTTKEQANIMLQNLLAERFHLKLRHETKEFQGYELVVGKNGHKLKDTSPEDAAFDQSLPRTPPPPPPPGPMTGPPKLDRPGMMMMGRMGGRGIVMHMTARAQTMKALVDTIIGQLNSPVTDKTGLVGKYDFTLDFAAEMPAGLSGMLPPPPPGVNVPSADSPEELSQTLPTALQQQLGLRLDAKKVPLPHLIVESADKTPTEN